jgi:hypothetical protein
MESLNNRYDGSSQRIARPEPDECGARGVAPQVIGTRFGRASALEVRQ